MQTETRGRNLACGAPLVKKGGTHENIRNELHNQCTW